MPKPESIATKSTSAASDTAPSEEPTESKIGEKVASVIGEAAAAAKTIVADTDDTQEHNEL